MCIQVSHLPFCRNLLSLGHIFQQKFPEQIELSRKKKQIKVKELKEKPDPLTGHLMSQSDKD